MGRDAVTEKTVKEFLEYLDSVTGVEYDIPLIGEASLGQMPLCNRTITDDMIKMYSYAIGDPNPLWRDPEYAAKTRWGGIIAPPMAEVMIAEHAGSPIIPAIPGLLMTNGGSRRDYHNVIRPMDRFTAKGMFMGMEDKTRPGKGYRLYKLPTQRKFYNQNGELVITLTTNVFFQLLDEVKEAEELPPVNRRRFTEEELDTIYSQYSRVLDGETRRGAETRYWEDVNVGDEIPQSIIGPYDSCDGISFMGITGFVYAYASKYALMRDFKEGVCIDPETGHKRCGLDWHFFDSVARQIGVPMAPTIGTHTETGIMHIVTDWMGDDAFVTCIDSHIRGMSFNGEALWCKATVTEKYVKDGKHLVELDGWTENFHTGAKLILCKIYVELPSRG